jgi:hypothetical protein
MNSDGTPLTPAERAEREEAYIAAWNAAVDRLKALGEALVADGWDKVYNKWQRLHEQYQRGERWG